MFSDKSLGLGDSSGAFHVEKCAQNHGSSSKKQHIFADEKNAAVPCWISVGHPYLIGIVIRERAEQKRSSAKSSRCSYLNHQIPLSLPVTFWPIRAAVASQGKRPRRAPLKSCRF